MEIAKSLQKIPSSYIREILQAASDPNVLSLAGGLPDEQTFPVEIMQETLEKLAQIPKVFQYGNTAGYGPLLEHVTALYQLPETHSAMVTTGSQQGIDLIARAFIDPGDKIVMEAPSYLGAMQVFGLVQADMITVQQNTQGPDLEQLEATFAEHSPKLFYCVPDFHNPTGVCWALETRKKVAALCLQYGVALIEDAPYRELRFSGDMLPLVSSFCAECSIVLRSFSKIASPGLRLGVVTGPDELIQPLGKVKQGADLHSSIPMQALLLGLLQHSGFDAHISSICELYSTRYQRLLSELTQHLPASCTANPVDGGMFIWVTLPECDAFALARTLLEHGVAVVPSDVFYPPGVKPQAALRLNFTNSSLDDLAEAVQRLVKVLAEQL